MTPNFPPTLPNEIRIIIGSHSISPIMLFDLFGDGVTTFIADHHPAAHHLVTMLKEENDANIRFDIYPSCYRHGDRMHQGPFHIAVVMDEKAAVLWRLHGGAWLGQ